METFTVPQAAIVLGKTAAEINEVIRKGGIKEITTESTEEGIRYILTKGSVDQLGAKFKTVPNYEKSIENGEMLTINPEKFAAIIDSIGIKKSVISRAIGYGDSYVSMCANRAKISKQAAEKISQVFDVDIEKAVVKTAAEPAKKEPIAQSQTVDGEAIRKAVCNGMIDAFVIVLKEDQIGKILAKTFESEEFFSSINRAVYGALKGIRTQEERETHKGLIPQARAKR